MQILKEEIRNQIIDAAKEEILEKGVEKMSMRSIAKKADISPSNIYHYFEDKKDLTKHILGPGLEKINTVLKNITEGNINFELDNKSYTKQDVDLCLDRLSTGIMGLYEKLDKVTMVILSSPFYYVDIEVWFTDVLYKTFGASFEAENEKTRLFSCRILASSIIYGISLIFKNIDEILRDEIDPYVIMKNYLGVFMCDGKK